MGTSFVNPYKPPQPRRVKRWVTVLLVVVVTLGAFVGGLTLGLNYTADVKAQGLVASLKITQRLAPQTLAKAVDFSQFWQIWDYLKSQALNSSKINDIDLFYGAEAGLVAALNDPYSVFFPPKKAQEFTQELSGKFQGIGAEVGMKNDKLAIIAPLPDSPAEKAGLRPGDIIAAIDDEDTTGMPIDLAIGKIRGQGGTVVTLKILRGTVLLTVPITRAMINVPNTKLTFDNDVAILKLYHFNDGVTDEFADAVSKIKARGSKKLILDLRNNPGGYLDAAVSISSYWLKNDEVVVYEKSSDSTLKVYMANGTADLRGLKTVVLINGGAASASEIVAGALQDYKLATLVGEKTFGKGSVQNFQQFNDGSALKLTIAGWLTPKQRTINEVGISPDIEVKTPTDTSSQADPQLDRAKAILNQ